MGITVKGRFDHFNINVTNLERSIAFYEQALGLEGTSSQGGAGWLFHVGLSNRRDNHILVGADLASRQGWGL